MQEKGIDIMTISKQRLDKIKLISDNDIDYSDIPELDDDWFEKASLYMVDSKPVPVELDNDVVEWYRTQDQNYKIRINAILRAYMNKHRANA